MTEEELEDEQDRIAFENLTFYPQVKYIRANLRLVREAGHWHDACQQIQSELNELVQRRLKQIDTLQQLREDQERVQLEISRDQSKFAVSDSERRRELEEVQLKILQRQNANERADEMEAARWASMLSDVCDRYIPSGVMV